MLLYSVYGGSTLYGIKVPGSDQDIRGVFIEPANVFFSLDTLDYYEDIPSDTVMFSLRKFIQLALKNNPNTLELLFAPWHKWITSTPYWEQIYNIRFSFLSERAVKAYKGFLLQEYDKIVDNKTNRTDLLELYGYDTKAASHVYRLAYNLGQLMSWQQFNPSLSGDQRYTALSIKSGAISKERALECINIELAYVKSHKQSHLPSEPDYKLINTLITGIQQQILYEEIHSLHSIVSS